jgi:hypothetical protein
MYSLRTRVQKSQDQIRIARQAHYRGDVERFRRAYAVHDLLAVHRLVFGVESDEVEADGCAEFDQIRRRESDAYADDALTGGDLRFCLVGAHFEIPFPWFLIAPVRPNLETAQQT